MPDDANWDSSAGLVISGETGSSAEAKSSTEEAKAIETENEPLANETGIAANVEGLEEPRGGTDGYNTEMLFNLIKKSPEALSIMQAIVDDVIGGDDPNFKYLGNSSGERRIRDCKEFWNSGAKESVADFLLDLLIVGDGYLYKRKIGETEARSILKDKIRENHDFNFRSSADLAASKVVEELRARDEDLFSTRKLQMVPASTVEHDINKYGDITNFHQEVGTAEADLPPDKVIHMNYMRLNGKTYGFTPARSIISELTMLAEAKDHNGQFFENAGIVNKVVKMPNAGPEDANYKLVKKTLKKFRKLKNKHQDLVLTGEMEIEDLNDMSDMDFQELATYITKVIVMAWGVPPTRIGMPIGGDSGARTSSLTHEGYFKRISRLQDKLQSLLNDELFEPEFNCRIKFEAPNIKREIRKADRDMRKLEVARNMVALGIWDREAVKDYMGVNDYEGPDLGDVSEEEYMQIAADLSSSKNNLIDDETINRDTAADAEAADAQAMANGENGETS
ncbi:MAG: phage portal protein [Candidatus Nanohaloarchaea archaeon]|nr:phage portal protein [Candidatus Nanohaloarchaea archaeon]